MNSPTPVFEPTSSIQDAIDTGWMTDQIRASTIAQQPTGRLGTPNDTADLVRFPLSKQGEWINGQLLYSNGGYPRGRLPV